MTPPLTEFERNARTVLEESLARVDARTRSRLTQARHAALEAALARPRRPAAWRNFTLMPAAGVAAAALLAAVMLWHREPGGTEPPLFETRAATAEDLDLLADKDALDLMEGWDGSFYEWAAAQTDTNGESAG